ncbi:hypothetical protein KW850_32510 [Bacillus sp. sid0103]|uniref:peptidase inhibitor family I36 protein n=1 Tax=Bacillus sp. sid0103 TaxID=2856337 RepID=UPI001C462662|nr:peptidase inhibitor family I36 protein [Bacillus sp. sid0103]MBV7509793.1 hypothetical protein [Bacillus sp. sid0103]
MYDPKDITRFNGHELHFVKAPSGDYLLVVDDQELMNYWVRLAYHEILKYRQIVGGGKPPGLIQGHKPVKKLPTPPPFQPYPSPGSPEGFGGPPTQYPTWGPGGAVPVYDANFYEDINFEGDKLTLKPNHGHHDLTDVSMGLFQGDWNDKISSVNFGQSIKVCALYEDVNWKGQTLHLLTWDKNLHTSGWGDRASGIATW